MFEQGVEPLHDRHVFLVVRTNDDADVLHLEVEGIVHDRALVDHRDGFSVLAVVDDREDGLVGRCLQVVGLMGVPLLPFTGMYCVPEPVVREDAGLQLQRRRVSVVLQKLWRVDSVPREIESALEVHLLLVPTLSDRRPQVLVDVEHLQEGVILHDGVDGLQCHVVDLEGRLHQGGFSLGRDVCLALLVPVGVFFAPVPVQRWLVAVENLVLLELCNTIRSRLDNNARKIVGDASWQLVEISHILEKYGADTEAN